jgi:type II secretory pathway component GspD/PulD (secretin)
MTTKLSSTPLLLSLSAALLAPALAQDTPPTNPPASASATVAEASPAPTRGRPGLRFNFRGAPLETVLNYMSEAAGFVIVLETPVRGTIDMWSAQPISREEAVDLLNLALNKNGHTATVQGRNLIVSSKEEAKKRNLPIRTGNDPHEIPATAEMVMQVIPLRHIDATQAARDLATLLPYSATLTANQDSNSLVVTDTQINVRHIVTLVSALDSSSDSVSTMRVFKLQNADPSEMASLLTSLFSTPTTGTAGGAALAAQLRPGGFPGGFPGNRGGPNNNNRGGRSGAAANTANRGTPVVVVPDPRTFSVIVTAAKDDMPGIAEIVAQLDSSSARKQKVFVYTLENADVRQVETVLKNLFQSTNARTTTTNQPDPLTTRASSNTQATGTNIQLGTARAGGGGLR